MNDDFEKKCHELEATISVLQNENNLLSERAEETLLTSLISDSIRSIDDSVLLIETILEKISILKNIQYCACCELKENKAIQNYVYSAFSELDYSNSEITLSSSIIKELNEGLVFITNGVNSKKGFAIDFKNSYFKPFSAYIFPFTTKSVPDGLFIFIDDEHDETKFRTISMLLQNIIDMLVEKLDKITLIEELNQLNVELDHRIKVRTKSLIETNRKLSEEIIDRKRIEEAFKQNEYLFRESQRAAAIGSYRSEFSPNDRWVTSEVLDQIFGMDSNYNKTFQGWTELLHPDSAEEIVRYVKEDVIGKNIPFNKEYKIIRQTDGETRWVWGLGKTILDDKGTVVGLIGIIQDITERKQADGEKKRLESQLQQIQKMESIGTLAGGIAHDFNNILFPILGYSEMLLDDVPIDSPIHDSLNKIHTGALRAKDLVQQILTFSRQEKSDLKLMRIQPIIKEALRFIRSTIPTTIDIRQMIQDDCGMIKADPTQIHQIIMNLTTNAYHAMEETGGELKVDLKEMELGALDLINPNMAPGVYACLIVSDTGVGMDKKLTAKIFDPFFTTKAIGKGTGMGLSVVHGIVNSMGGGIQVYSEPGKGTEFKVYIAVEKSSSEEQQRKVKQSIQGGTEHILLVDDEEEIITMEKQMLERLGYKVTSRTSSIEALEAFRVNHDRFDLVITDMAMPNLPGDKLSVELIKIRPDIPILLCTGFSENMLQEKAVSLGIKDFLMKPIVMNDLAQKVREVLDEKGS